ncbi:DUF1489 family protein [Pararhodobacter aggregans]|uniref:DUF1489 domain-containing protein n=1 Tax=Pararhodobacter aggregans TaxID=404875 RepID=A0A2T7UR64_9RHOB|nr:DUF1489 domain-containing protein [Pararhodobacter aggregans]PTX01967.1 hypothetical protein C8N33_106185 [Pararhodobacter aggregans]PVE47152.1 DUF1489 domain-containing protein [Pararhodobacter aggregans]
MALHILKLCVGCESVEDLALWQQERAAELPGGLPRHVTRMWPKRADEVLDGGSIYWIIKGNVLVRQRILRLDPVEGTDGINRCALVFDPALIRTEPAPRRPFQGWRYLKPEDAPRDLPEARPGEEVLPPELAEALAEFGWR